MELQQVVDKKGNLYYNTFENRKIIIIILGYSFLGGSAYYNRHDLLRHKGYRLLFVVFLAEIIENWS